MSFEKWGGEGFWGGGLSCFFYTRPAEPCLNTAEHGWRKKNEVGTQLGCNTLQSDQKYPKGASSDWPLSFLHVPLLLSWLLPGSVYAFPCMNSLPSLCYSSCLAELCTDPNFKSPVWFLVRTGTFLALSPGKVTSVLRCYWQMLHVHPYSPQVPLSQITAQKDLLALGCFCALHIIYTT